MQQVQQYQALLKVHLPFFTPCPLPMTGGVRPDLLSSQELIRNKARNQQNCALLEQAYAVVSALPQRAENQLHVSLMENYPGTLEALGEPIRQVWGGAMGVGSRVVGDCVQADHGPTILPGSLHRLGGGARCEDALEGSPPPRIPFPPPPGGLQAQEGLTH